MIGGPKAPTSCLARVISGEMDVEQEKRKGWSNHSILVVDVDDRRLGWPEREMVKHLAKKLFGSQAVKDVGHGR